MEDTSPDTHKTKGAPIWGVFRFVLKFALWVTAVIVIAPLLLFSLIYYLHMNPFGHGRFDRTEWLSDDMQEGAYRCGVADTLIDEILEPGMARAEIEAILGANEKPYDVRSDKTETYAYYLGWCSPMAWDPYSLIVHYGQDGILISAYTIQH